MHDATLYPERYRPRDDGPMFSEYVPQRPTDLGHDCGKALPAREGTIIACVEHGNYGGRNYYIDQDFTLVSEGATYMIWTHDSWAFIEPPKWITGAGYRRTSAIHELLEAQVG